jgi:hypothetical protein
MADKDPEEAARLAAIEQCTIPPGSATVCVRMLSAHGAKQIDGTAGASAYVDILTHMMLSFTGKIKKLIKNLDAARGCAPSHSQRPARLDRRQLYFHLLPGQPLCCSMKC